MPLGESHSSNRNPFYLVKGNLVAGSIIQLRCSGRLVGSDALGVFNHAAVLKIGGDPGGPEGLAPA